MRKISVTLKEKYNIHLYKMYVILYDQGLTTGVDPAISKGAFPTQDKGGFQTYMYVPIQMH